MRQKNLEIEIRFGVDDIKDLRRKLCELGLECAERWKGKDIIFDRKKELIPKGKVLRLRLGMEKNNKGKLTYKGSNQSRVFKIREEFETIIENPEMAIKILKGLSYLPVIQYEKRTELWIYGGADIYIEELPVIGHFVEIEGTKKSIKRVAGLLGFDTKKGIRKSYREYFTELNKNKKEWVFGK